MIKAVLLLSLSAACIGDNAPQSAYAPPSTGYDTPSTGYDDPTGYDAPTGYDQGGYDQGGYDQGGYDQGGYGDVADCRTTGTCGPDFDIGAKIGEFLPLFVAVFAAIILSSLLGPLLLGLFNSIFMLVISILPLAACPKGNAINFLLNTFDLTLCSTGVNPVFGVPVTVPAPAVFPPAGNVGCPVGRSFSSRELHDSIGLFGFDISEDRLDIISSFAQNAFNAFSSGAEE